MRNLRALLAYAVLFTLNVAAAQTASLAPDKKAQIEAAVSRFMASSHAPGVSVAVIENNELEWSGGFGMADLENFVPATSHTLYRLGSISKPITAVAAMQLWEQGKLDLDAPVQKYCPAFPQKPWPVTTRGLLSHTAGVRHYKGDSQDDLEIGNTKHFDDTVSSGLKFFANDPLVSEPGKEFHYSTQGFTVVACAIEGASGSKYVEFVQRNVFLPAGMTRTVTDNRFSIVPQRTRFYQRDKNDDVLNAEFLDSSYKIAGGGWLSSADDLAAFAIAMLDNKLVRSSTRDLMWTPVKLADGKTSDYALGWGTGHSLGMLDVGHGGGQQGTSTFLMIVPERRAAVAVLANMERVGSSDLAQEIIRILLGIPKPEPKK